MKKIIYFYVILLFINNKILAQECNQTVMVDYAEDLVHSGEDGIRGGIFLVPSQRFVIDIPVQVNTSFSISQFQIDLMLNEDTELQPDYYELVFYNSDNSGLILESSLIQTYTNMVPTSMVSVHSPSYFPEYLEVYRLTFELLEPINLIGQDTPFWLEIKNPDNIAIAAVYGSTDVNDFIGEPAYYFSSISPDNGWVNSGYELIYTLSGLCDTLGTEDIADNLQMSISPNPVKDILKINTQTEISNIEIYDTLGRLIQVLTTNESNSYNVESLPKGNYLIKIKTVDNQIKTSKIIKL